MAKDSETLEVISSLKELSKDETLPQSIRDGSSDALDTIAGNSEPLETRKNKALQILEDLIIDLNLDLSTKTTIYHTISLLESLNNSNSSSLK